MGSQAPNSWVGGSMVRRIGSRLALAIHFVMVLPVIGFAYPYHVQIYRISLPNLEQNQTYTHNEETQILEEVFVGTERVSNIKAEMSSAATNVAASTITTPSPFNGLPQNPFNRTQARQPTKSFVDGPGAEVRGSPFPEHDIRGFKSVWFEGRLPAIASLFQIQQINIARDDPDRSGTYIPAGDHRSHSFELEPDDQLSFDPKHLW